MGKGLLFAALSGLGKGLADSAERDEKVRIATEAEDKRMSHEKDMVAERARIEEQKLLRIAESKQRMDREEAASRGAAIDAETKRAQNQRIAEDINKKYGSSMSADDAESIRGNNEARKAYGLSESSRKADLSDRADAAQKLGYLDDAREARGQVQTEIANERLDLAEKKQDQQFEYLKKQDARRERMAQAETKWRETRAEKEDTKAENIAKNNYRLTVQENLRSVDKDIKTFQKELADGMLDPKQKTIVEEQLAEAREQQKFYRSSLDELIGLKKPGKPDAPRPDKPFDPNDFRKK
jgi:hypothetical protein